MTQSNTTDPAGLSADERAKLLADWCAKNRARTNEQQRPQARIYHRTIGDETADALQKALALHNGDGENTIDDAAALAIITRDIQFWDAAIGQLAHLVARDRENASAAANLAAKPVYMARLRGLADSCEAVWKAFLAVDAVGADLRAAGHTPSSWVLPNAPLYSLAAFNPNNPMSQLAAFKTMLESHGA